MKFVCMLADVCVYAHIYVYSHARIKHNPTKYKCIYTQMGKTPIFSVETVSVNNQILSNLNNKNRSHQSKYKEGIILSPLSVLFNIE